MKKNFKVSYVSGVSKVTKNDVSRHEATEPKTCNHLITQSLSYLITSKTAAFSLAEVLITIAIIGIVAAMTIPSLVTKYQERVVVSKLKKAYSVLSQAWQLAVIDYGTPERWDLGGDGNSLCNKDEEGNVNPLCGKGANNAMIILSKYMQIDKMCQANKDKNCAFGHTRLDASISGETTPTNDADDDAYKQDSHTYAYLANGDTIAIYTYSADCSINYGTGKLSQNICFAVYYDINGIQKPNVWGKDYFIFFVGKNGVVPIGIQDTFAGGNSFANRCKNDTEFQDGFGCAGWVIENENLDYLHCDGLSWEEKRSCNHNK